MKTDELDFELPQELIAQTPTPERSASRLLHYRRADQSIAHRRFSDLPGLRRRGDLLVFNDARVIPARFMLRKPTGGRVEGLFLAELRRGRWQVMLRNLGPADSEPVLCCEDDPHTLMLVLRQDSDGTYEVELNRSRPAVKLLERLGRMPLPPYIKREKQFDVRDAEDRERYQTIYARASGSVAAPTAGLHFTEDLLRELERHGIERAFITLHVGLGTFKPVTAERLEEHEMHVEHYSVRPEAAEALNRAQRDKRRIIAIGTTSARVLESQPADRPFEPKADKTGIFIYPPYQWRHVDALITNFHLPRSTLIALVAAMTGLEEQRRIYREAIEQRYRFFSYGDAMLIE